MRMRWGKQSSLEHFGKHLDLTVQTMYAGKNKTASWLRVLRLQLPSNLTQKAVHGIQYEADLLRHFGLSSKDIIFKAGENSNTQKTFDGSAG